jgi:hypothetical protein
LRRDDEERHVAKGSADAPFERNNHRTRFRLLTSENHNHVPAAPQPARRSLAVAIGHVTPRFPRTALLHDRL